MNPCITFSPLQSAVIACLLDGMRLKESARAIGRSVSTVSKARERIYAKVGAKNAHQAAAIVARTL